MPAVCYAVRLNASSWAAEEKAGSCTDGFVLLGASLGAGRYYCPLRLSCLCECVSFCLFGVTSSAVLDDEAALTLTLTLNSSRCVNGAQGRSGRWWGREHSVYECMYMLYYCCEGDRWRVA